MSVKLIDKLTSLKQYCCGTIRVNRKGLPTDIPKDKLMTKGEIFSRYRRNLVIYKWMDNRGVHIAANYEKETIEMVDRKDKTGKKTKTPCPGLISDYNKYMGGVDRMDQLIALYQRDRKSKKYWLRIYFYLFEVCMVNAFVLYRKHHEKDISFLDFRNQVYLGFKETKNLNRRSCRLKDLSI